MTLPSFPLTVTEPGRADAVLSAALDGLTRSAAQRLSLIHISEPTRPY